MTSISSRWGVPTSLPPLSQSLAPTRAPKIIIFRNGDPFFTGRKFVLRKPHYSMDTLLDFLTDGMVPYPAVQKLYLPEDGSRVKSLSQIQDGRVYVAGGNEAFRHMDYAGARYTFITFF